MQASQPTALASASSASPDRCAHSCASTNGRSNGSRSGCTIVSSASGLIMPSTPVHMKNGVMSSEYFGRPGVASGSRFELRQRLVHRVAQLLDDLLEAEHLAGGRAQAQPRRRARWRRRSRLQELRRHRRRRPRAQVERDRQAPVVEAPQHHEHDGEDRRRCARCGGCPPTARRRRSRGGRRSARRANRRSGEVQRGDDEEVQQRERHQVAAGRQPALKSAGRCRASRTARRPTRESARSVIAAATSGATSQNDTGSECGYGWLRHESSPVMRRTDR